MRLGWKESKWMGQLRVEASNYVHLFIPSFLYCVCQTSRAHQSASPQPELPAAGVLVGN